MSHPPGRVYHHETIRRNLWRGLYLTLKSVPDDFSRAHSSGLCPGARATFALALPFVLTFGGFFVVVTGRERPPLEGPTLRVLLFVGRKEGGGMAFASRGDKPPAEGAERDKNVLEMFLSEQYYGAWYHNAAVMIFVSH